MQISSRVAKSLSPSTNKKFSQWVTHSLAAKRKLRGSRLFWVLVEFFKSVSDWTQRKAITESYLPWGPFCGPVLGQHIVLVPLQSNISGCDVQGI